MKRFSKIFLPAILLFFIQNISAQQKNKEEILHLLQFQEDAWNNGNIDLFMTGYWNDDSLAFVGSKSVTYGWKNTIANYKKSYPDTVTMGKLHFDILKVDVLDKKNAFVIGKWHLTRSIGDVGGHFTLLFKKFGNHWFIVVDHTS